MTDTTNSSMTWNDWIGADVLDQSGDKIGSLENVYMDRATGHPEWLAVRTGMLGRNESFIPIDEQVTSAGSDLQVPYGKDHVKGAPSVDPENAELEPDDEAKLYDYYGLDGYQQWDDSRDRDAEGTGGRDTSGSGTDSAMTRSEEELDVETASHEAGRARLRKYVVTENVTTTVPVRKEKVRLEREPVTDANVGEATDGPDISEDEHEIVLNEEEAVVSKRTVPKERVRLDKEVVTEQREVSDDVRKERVEVEGDAETKG